MAKGKFVSYLRLSTSREGASGSGLEPQRAAVASHVNRRNRSLLEEFVEVKSRQRCDRPALASALRLCRQERAVLIIAKLGRLGRNVHFICALMESQVEFIAMDLPHANKDTVQLIAAMAQQDAEVISERTKAGLQAAKARGTKLGGRKVSAARFAEMGARGRKESAKVRTVKSERFKAGVVPIIEEIRESGVISLRGIAAELHARGERTQRGMEWSSVQVMRILKGRKPTQKVPK